ncbi:hypothetical protein LJC49_11015 [Ruminococcaceae bacterium OttesenSCG-928-I18]|nr:hypothetical protein [Ruminococcaceae bacterium OttesenSCG-928-I18]
MGILVSIFASLGATTGILVFMKRRR